MPFKPFAHLARVSIAKGLTHAYAPSAVVAGQSLGFHNTSVNKFSKVTQLQNAFPGPSSSGTGAGAKTGHIGQSNTGDSGLAQYYAAWQHAQQTGDDTDWKQHQSARKIGWKGSEKPSTTSKPSHHRLDSIKAADILRPSTHRTRRYSESILTEHKDANEAFDEAAALAKVDEAIAQEIKDVNESRLANNASDAAMQVVADGQHDISQTASQVSDTADTEARTSSTTLTSPVIDDTAALSENIIQLSLQHRYTEIPQLFESMIKDGLVPTAEAYNQIIVSAIQLSKGYQPYPQALSIYSDMTSRSVTATRETYDILMSFLTTQSLEALEMQKKLAQSTLRHGSTVLPSLRRQQELYSGDMSLQFAIKFYNIASASVANFRLTSSQYNKMLKAFAQNGSTQHMKQLLSDMRVQRVPVQLELYTIIIDACASVKDTEAAQQYYAEYRDTAIRRTLEPLDVKVYIAMIRAFYAAGEEEKGIRFYEQILQSFEGTADRSISSKQVTDALVIDGLVSHHVELGQYDRALESLQSYPLSHDIQVEALNKICIAAADKSELDTTSAIYAQLSPADTSAESAMAVSSMYFRAGQIDEALASWSKVQHFAQNSAVTVDFAAMFALSLINAGRIEQGLSQVRAMFRQVRSATSSQSSPQLTNRTLDEAINFFGQTLSGTNTIYSAQASLQLFRLMIENGGLVPHLTREAIARLGPECVNQLSPQDIALALHVQAQMLPLQTSAINDTAQAERFSHLLETVLDRGILMDPSTLHAVSDALPRLSGARPDLEQRWNDFMHPVVREPLMTQLVTPMSPLSPMARTPSVNSFDPYANTTDHRASRMIIDLLESTTGRIESHVSEAMSRLRNVRRMGRHLQYSAYAKLITAAGKAKQNNLMHEIVGMAQTDVPLNLQVPAVVAGWVSIYDAIVAACLTVGDRQLAAKYHHEIRNLGAAPSANTFGIYITTLEGTFDEATEAVKIFQQAIQEGVVPSVFLFNAVIGKLGKARRIDDCLHYFSQMQERGIKPSSVTYGTLVNALCRTSEESFAVQMFDEMEAAQNYRPRPAPYNSIIQYFLNTKRDRSKVLQYYGRMRSKNIKPTSHTYKLLIEAWATLEPINLAAAETVLADMKVNGVQPEAVHYGSLIHARGCVQSDMTGARKVFDSVIADKSIKPTDNLYQNLFESMVANKLVDQTDDLLVDMKKRGIAMTPYIANTLIHGWAGKGDVAKARSIYESLGVDHREPSTYEAMTRAFLTAEDRIGAQTVVSEMLRKGYPSAVSEKVLALIGASN